MASRACYRFIFVNASGADSPKTLRAETRLAASKASLRPEPNPINCIPGGETRRQHLR